MTLWNGLRDYPSTNHRIFVSVWLEVLYVVVLLACLVANRFVNTELAYIVGGFILVCLGLGAAQFYGKRKTDTAFVAAKNSSAQPNVTVEQNASPSTVTVEQRPAADAVMPLRSMIPKSRASSSAPSGVTPLTHRDREAD